MTSNSRCGNLDGNRTFLTVFCYSFTNSSRAVVWTGVGVALCFTILRIWIRIKFNGRFQLDDVFVVFALLLLMASAIMYTIILKPMFEIMRIAAGILPAPTTPVAAAAFVTATAFYLRVQFAVTLAFWTCLWVVKTSFLAFFYQLSNGLEWDRRLWYCVAVFCVCDYMACMISYPISCSQFTVDGCTLERNIELALISLRMSTALDILTDLAIMIIPWKLLWVVKLSRKKKTGIGSIVGLGMIIVVFAIIRIIITNSTGKRPEVVWLALWSSIETSIAVVVICLTSLKAFLPKRKISTTEYGSRPYTRTTADRNIKDEDMRGSIPLDDVSSNGEFGTYNRKPRSGPEGKQDSSNGSEEVLVH